MNTPIGNQKLLSNKTQEICLMKWKLIAVFTFMLALSIVLLIGSITNGPVVRADSASYQYQLELSIDNAPDENFTMKPVGSEVDPSGPDNLIWKAGTQPVITAAASRYGATSDNYATTIEPSDIEVGGIVSGVWDISGSPYIIVTDTVVPDFSVLTIEPGVEVRFDGHYKFIISGTLIAQGTVTDTILFTRNQPTDESRGWGIRFENASEDTSILSFCTIEHGYADNGSWDSSSDDRGGGVYVLNSNLVIENCHIRNNMATTGGGIYAWMYGGQTLVVRNNLIENNNAFNHGFNACGGGGINVHGGYSSTVRIENNRVVGNSYSGNDRNYEGGGGIQLYGGTATVINNTIYGNSSPKGSGIHTVVGYSGLIANNIVWGNTGSVNDDQITIETGFEPGVIPEGLAIHYNDIQDGAILVIYRNTPQGIEYTDGIGNIDSDPLFVDSANGDFHLSSDSPCRNVGTGDGAPSDDMDGEPRPMGSGYDIGADEYTDYIPVQADFTASSVSGVAPLSVVFTNTSSGDYDSSLWDFGDELTSTLESPTHTYTAAGIYTVTLSVNGPGGSDTLPRPNYVTVYRPVVADFSGSPVSGPSPLATGFTNLSTGDYDTCAWTFGDGATSNDCTDPNHTYTAAGIYTVTLSVNGPGGSDTKTKDEYIIVSESAPEEHIAYLPIALRNYTPPTQLYFDDFSDPTSGWDTGDLGCVQFSYQDGEYEILLLCYGWWGGVTSPFGGFSDHAVEADMREYDGSWAIYGLIFGRVDWDHYYLFKVDPIIQTYSLVRYDPSPVTIIGSTPSSYINPADGTNRLRVERQGDQISVCVNGHFLTTVQDDTYMGDLEVGLWAGSSAEVPDTVRFDNFRVLQLETGIAGVKVSLPRASKSSAFSGLDSVR